MVLQVRLQNWSKHYVNIFKVFKNCKFIYFFNLVEPQAHFREKNSNELLEKALSGEIIQVNEPDVLSSTSLNITWRVVKSIYLIEGFILKYRQTGTTDFFVEKLNDNKKRSFILNNLLKFTTYEVFLEPFSGVVHGSESNIVQVKTKEDGKLML